MKEDSEDNEWMMPATGLPGQMYMVSLEDPGAVITKGIFPMNPPVGVTVSASSAMYKYHHLDPELAKRLVAIYRIMFPHNGVPDGFYEHVVRRLDDKAAQNEELPRFLSEGIEALNGQIGSSWFCLSEEARLEALKRTEQTFFFQTLRSDFVLYFYGNPAICSQIWVDFWRCLARKHIHDQSSWRTDLNFWRLFWQAIDRNN
jgi:hypothetical protein